MKPSLANVLANLWFDAAGRRLAVATEHGGLHVWDPNEGRELARLAHEAELVGVQFTRDGRRLVSLANRVVRVWDLGAAREVTRRTHPSWVRALAVSADGALVASSSDDTIVVWEAATGREVTRFAHPGGRRRSRSPPMGVVSRAEASSIGPPASGTSPGAASY